jgi:hypothetical protein
MTNPNFPASYSDQDIEIITKIHNAITGQFTLSPAFVSDYLDKYYILHWTGDYLCKKILSLPVHHIDQPYIIHQGVLYYPEVEDPETEELIIEDSKAEIYKISFRKLKNASHGVALIRKIESK